MPVAFDNVGSTAQTATSSLTVVLTLTTGAVLLAFVSGNDTTGSVSAIAYNGVALTRLGFAGAGTGSRVEAWGLTAPAAGVHDLVAQFSDGVTVWEMVGVSYVNAKAAGPFGTVASATASAVTVVLSVSVGGANDMVAAGFMQRADNISAMSITNRSSAGPSYAFYVGDTAGAATVSISAIIAGAISGNWAMVAVPILFSAAAAATTPLMCLLGAGL